MTECPNLAWERDWETYWNLVGWLQSQTWSIHIHIIFVLTVNRLIFKSESGNCKNFVQGWDEVKVNKWVGRGLEMSLRSGYWQMELKSFYSINENKALGYIPVPTLCYVGSMCRAFIRTNLMVLQLYLGCLKTVQSRQNIHWWNIFHFFPKTFSHPAVRSHRL